ncbi:hypothetical protein KIPB_012293 [Kipferlia bialata]|uniref:Uncharacterized protein n=1 Tax=Kipferlia bialata TaxID=797122 RepID=A0A9K3D9I1_9EUKA|nr:hypothetical protein KIPB_012293 [Kipferlia bialata]|eukprot:g12293.t1
MTDYSQCIGYRYHVDFVPGSHVNGWPAVDLSEQGCQMEGTVQQLTAEYLHLHSATCIFIHRGQAFSVYSPNGWTIPTPSIASSRLVPSHLS